MPTDLADSVVLVLLDLERTLRAVLLDLLFVAGVVVLLVLVVFFDGEPAWYEPSASRPLTRQRARWITVRQRVMPLGGNSPAMSFSYKSKRHTN